MSAPLATATAAAAPVADPIDEAPEAIWYVRPPSGGQYGPARGDVLRKWITEGRVSADSMVWREGWADWRGGGEVFPYLRSAIATSPPGHVPLPAASPLATAGSRSYPARRRNNSLTLAITTVVVLGLMSIALLVTLVLVVT